MSKIRIDGSYVYLRPDGRGQYPSHVPLVARTVHVRPDLLVDLFPDGRVIGVERLSGAVTAEDLAAVLVALPLEEGRTDG